MKKYLILAALILLMPLSVNADEWNLIQKNDKGLIEVNVTSMHRNGDVVSFWRKKEAVKHAIVESTYYYESINCVKKAYTTHESDTYIKKHLIHTNNLMTETSIEAGSIKEKIADFVCSYNPAFP